MRFAQRLVAERAARETATAVDEMLPWIDAVRMAVEERRDRLAHAHPVRAVHRAARKPCDQRAFHLLLKIDDRIVAFANELMPECAELAPGRARKRAMTPAPQCDGYDATHAPVQPHQRGKRLFDDPVDCEPRPVLVKVMHDRQRMDDIAQRRRTDDQRAGHRGADFFRGPAVWFMSDDGGWLAGGFARRIGGRGLVSKNNRRALPRSRRCPIRFPRSPFRSS